MKAIDIPGMGALARLGYRSLGSGLALGLAIGIIGMMGTAVPAGAQTAGESGLQGTVTDPSGAVVPNATVTATDNATGVATKRTSSSSGYYVIEPLIPGTYTVSVTAAGFKLNSQQNIVLNGYSITGLNIKLAVGAESQTVVVTTAPPALNTTSPAVGGVMDNKTYESLPILMSGQQRDPTAFAVLMPGTSPATRAPNMSGTGQYVTEVYVDGLPTTTANQQGDNRVVVNSMPLESVNQMQVVSNGQSAEYQGAGTLSFSTQSGGNEYHGTVADFIRNTIFDTWGFTAPAATIPAVGGGTVPAGKPVEHQNEFVASAGGPVPFTHHKLFFFVTYDKYHGRNGVQPVQTTVPTALMKQGNFSELLGTAANGSPIGQIYDPLTSAACTGNSTNGPCRYQYGYGYGGTPGPNGDPVPNGLPVNVMPASEISGIAQYMQKFMPNPTSPAGVIANNYLAGGGGISGYDNWEAVGRFDYDLSARQRISFTYSHGLRQSIGYGATLPLPYTDGDSSAISPTQISVHDSFVLTPKLVNQFAYGFTRFPQPVNSPTDGLAPYRAGPDIGIGNLPPGQASDAFPGATFANTPLFTTALTTWTEDGASDATHNVVPNAFTVVDNLQWNKGRHSMTFGFQTQWLEDNTTSQTGYSGILQTAYTANDTSQFSGQSPSDTTNGYSYASYLLGAVNSAGTTIQAFDETGGRYHPYSPYFQDNFKVRPNLTLNLGLRWDYIPSYREVQDRWSFFNTSQTDPLTGTPGLLQFAGNRGAAISCECRTPVQKWWKNFGPRLGFEYAPNPKTVFSGGWSVTYSRAGGVGGRGGDSTGTGQEGFTANLVLPPAVNSGVNSGPSFYLNNSSAFQGAGLANINFGGPGFVLPAPAQPSAAVLTNGIGNYMSNGSYIAAGGAPSYADPYLSSRAPEFVFYNASMQRALTNDLTIQATYSGSQSHFVGGSGVPGFWSGALNTSYIAPLASVVGTDNTTNILSEPSTPANIAIAQKAVPGITVPYAGYVQTQAGSPNTSASINRMLRPYPKYSSPPSPAWDNVGNFSYNAFLLTLNQRTWHGLSYTLNYTFAQNLSYGSPASWPVPAIDTSAGITNYAGNNHAEAYPQNGKQILTIYGVDELPFGRGKIGSNSFLVRTLAGGWALSGIFSYRSAIVYGISGNNCTAPTLPCRPDLNPNFSGPVRINGSYGHKITAAHLNAIQYLNPNAFTTPHTFPLAPGSNTLPNNAISKMGDAGPYPFNLSGPGSSDMDLSLRRSFNLTPKRVKFTFQADATNIFNKVTFGSPNTTWAPNSTTLGQISSASGNRDFQFSGRITF